MIPLEKLRAVRTVLAHGYPDGPCPDGMGSALIIRDAMPDVEVRFLVSESRELQELHVERGMLFVDVSPPSKRLPAFISAGAIVLDHHDTVKEDVALFREFGVFADAKTEPGVSGALLAYRHVWQPLMDAAAIGQIDLYDANARVRTFAELVGVRDTWQKDDPRFRAASEQASALFFFPWSTWSELKRPFTDPEQHEVLRRRLALGPDLRARSDELARSLAAGAFRFVTEKGTRVAILPSSIISDAAELVEDVDIVCGFSFRCDHGVPKMKLSLRSRGDFVVRHIAERLGGGGHAHAASAWMELHAAHQHPYAVVRTVMSAL